MRHRPVMTAIPRPTRDALAQWAQTPACRLLVLFGSTAAGRATTTSDIDVALEFDTLPEPERRLAIIGELQDLCAPRPVDVVFLHRDTSPVLRMEVFRTGRPLHEAVPGLFVSGAVRALGQYEDAVPFRRRLRSHVAAGSIAR